ncbi:hypothetical protein SPFM10_00229 [Salmonella phage SPFM10]|nr:hypothetical protein SPFM10_00229 [Salmonella phage SPFM10]
MTHLPDGQKHTHLSRIDIAVEGADAFFPEIDRVIIGGASIYQQTLARADRIYHLAIKALERIEKDTGKEQEVNISGREEHTDMRLVTFHTSIVGCRPLPNRGNLIVTRNPEGYFKAITTGKNVIMGSKTWESCNNAIGKNNELPWRLPADLARII